MTPAACQQAGAVGVRLVSAGLAGPWALGVLVVAGEVAGGVSGPCGIAALLLAALAALLAAVCHAEISRRRHASLYEGARDVLGVRSALVLGWASAAWRVTALAVCARGLGATMDYIMGGRVRQFTSAWMDKVVPAWSGVLTPDPLAGGATAFTTLLFSLGLERSRALRLLLNACVFLAALFFVSAGATHCEPEAWRQHPFLPAGTTGLLAGAALSYAGLLGVTSVRAESARCWARSGARAGPSRHLELAASVVALLVAVCASLAVIAVLTMMVNFRSLDSDAPVLVQAFEIRDLDWARLVMATLGISGLALALVDLAPPLHRLVRALAADGLLPLNLARDCALTGTPVAAIVICGAAVSVLALMSPLVPLLQVAACGALVVNVSSAGAATLLRFQSDPELVTTVTAISTRRRLSVQGLRARLGSIPAVVRRAGEACRWSRETGGDSEERAPLVLEGAPAVPSPSSSELSGYETDSSSCSTDIDAVVAEFKEKIKVATLSEYAPHSVAPDAVTARRATLALSAALVTGTIACSTLLALLEQGAGSSLLVVCVACSVATAALLGVAARQPQVQPKVDECRVPLAPWLPAVATLLHVTLLLQLMHDAWLQILLAIVPGAVAFSVREWRLARRRGVALRRRGERIHLHSPPVHPVVPTLVPSHRRLSPHSQRRITRVDTILISR